MKPNTETENPDRQATSGRVHPLVRRIHPLKLDWVSVIQCHENDPDLDGYGLYNELPDGTLEWVSDHATREDAEIAKKSNKKNHGN